MEVTNTIYIAKSDDRLCQGDILPDFRCAFVGREGDGYAVQDIAFPYAVVITQDCDLSEDYKARNSSPIKNNDKFLETISICPAFLSEDFKNGSHLSLLEMTRETWGGDLWRQLKKNNNKRFYFLEKDVDLKIPELIVDFKIVYTIGHNDAYSALTNCRATIKSLFRESLSQRYANYLSRIGLPEIKVDLPAVEPEC